MKVYKNQRAAKEVRKTYDELLNLWGISYEEKMVKNAYGSTHVLICGRQDGEPLVLFHGVGDDTALMWIYNAKALGQEYRIYAIDTIGGAGKSIPGNGYNKSFDDVLWIDSIFDDLNLSKVHIMGTSHGGYLAMRYLVARPKRVDKVIGISAAPSSGGKRGSMKLMFKIFMPEALFPSKANVSKLLYKLSGDQASVFIDNDCIMEHYYWLMRGFKNSAMMYHKVVGFTDGDMDLIKRRVFLLLGEKDPFELYGGEEVVKRNQLNARFYADAGHGLNHEKADDVNRLVLAILSGRMNNIRNY